MNRRRLVIVAVLAALFGAVLPYLELLVPRRNTTPEFVPVGAEGLGTADICWQLDSITIGYESASGFQSASTEDLLQFRKATHGLFPEDLMSERYSIAHVVRIGWPIRAAYGIDNVNMGRPIGPNWIPLPRWAERFGIHRYGLVDAKGIGIPTGIIWSGLLGNIAAMIAVFGGGYLGLSYWRARRRTRKGQCVNCGYLSNGAVVCPECGAIASEKNEPG